MALLSSKLGLNSNVTTPQGPQNPCTGCIRLSSVLRRSPGPGQSGLALPAPEHHAAALQADNAGPCRAGFVQIAFPLKVAPRLLVGPVLGLQLLILLAASTFFGGVGFGSYVATFDDECCCKTDIQPSQTKTVAISGGLP